MVDGNVLPLSNFCIAAKCSIRADITSVFAKGDNFSDNSRVNFLYLGDAIYS